MTSRPTFLRLRSLIAAEQLELLLARAAPPAQRLRTKCSQLQASLAFRRMQLSYARALVAFGKAGFNPAQPRVPAGYPDGGQWTREGGAADASPYRDVVRDTSGRQLWETECRAVVIHAALAGEDILGNATGTQGEEVVVPVLDPLHLRQVLARVLLGDNLGARRVQPLVAVGVVCKRIVEQVDEAERDASGEYRIPMGELARGREKKRRPQRMTCELDGISALPGPGPGG